MPKNDPSNCHEIATLLTDIMADFNDLPIFKTMAEYRASENSRITAKKAPCDKLKFLRCRKAFRKHDCEEVSGPYKLVKRKRKKKPMARKSGDKVIKVHQLGPLEEPEKREKKPTIPWWERRDMKDREKYREK